MPQTKLTGFKLTSQPQQESRRPVPGSQRRLESLQKVVKVKGGKLNFDISELVAAKRVLESKDADVAELLAVLRRLSCLQITRDMLLRVQIGTPLRQLKRHDNQDVARIAHTLVEKWKASLNSQKPRK